MKFRITKEELEKVSSFFGKKEVSYAELELEPCDLTATQAMREAKIREEGYLIGPREGRYEQLELCRKHRLAFYQPEFICKNCYCRI
jgi:hypothetical protein